MTMEDMNETSVSIPMSVRMKAWLEQAARAEDRSVASLGRRIILDEMERRGDAEFETDKQIEAEG